MKPVDQTKFGEPEGNCFFACVASILEIPLESTPDLSIYNDPSNPDHVNGWHKAIDDFLLPLGYVHLDVVLSRWDIAPKGYTIGNGRSPRDLEHSVVCLDGKMVHDPHPSRDGVNTFTSYTLLLPVVRV